MARSKPSDEVRRDTLERDKYKCVRCGKGLINQQASLHHRRLRSHHFEGTHKPSNLIWLCGSGTTGCHGWVHSHPTEAYEEGYMVHSYDDPVSKPVDYYGRGFVYLDNGGHKKIAI